MSPSPWSFSFEPLFLVGAGVAAALYRLSPSRAWRTASYLTGLALIVIALNSPLETLARNYLLTAHLAQNALIADIAPPLLILGLTPRMRAAVSQRLGRPFVVVTHPVCAVTIWLVAWYATHVPLVYDGALRHPGWLNLEHLVLITAGLVFWWPLIADPPQYLSAAARICCVAVGAFAVAPLGFALALSGSPFYGFYVTSQRVWGLTPIRDQSIGGILMNVEQSVVMFAALGYFLTVLMEDDREQSSSERLTQSRRWW